jgi:biotin carboxyl carrier protein
MRKIAVTIEGKTYTIEVRPDPNNRNAYTARINGEELSVTLPEKEGEPLPDWIVVGRQPYELIFDAELHWLQSSGRRYHLDIRDQEAAVTRPASGDGRVKSPIPGLVTRVLVTPGQAVEAGTPLLILEAMKMENEIRAPLSGTVQQVHVEGGQSVARLALLVEIA